MKKLYLIADDSDPENLTQADLDKATPINFAKGGPIDLEDGQTLSSYRIFHNDGSETIGKMPSETFNEGGYR